jgi:NADPH:quinone reductase-like Zn-dependent oxidoreductase
MTEQMQAVTRTEYGGPEVLSWSTAEVPPVEEGRLLVRVHAASPNAADWHLLRGKPYLVRPQLGWRRPRHETFGTDVAGTVAAVGPGVEGFAVGDRVVANSGSRGFAEYAPLRADLAVKLPDHVAFEEAATLPIAGVTALEGLRDHARVGPGDRVLVNGASGGVGHFAVQIAVLLGAEVTAVSSARNHDLVRGLGAADTIDYTSTDYTTTGRQWDVVLDVAGTRPAGANARALTPEGRWVIVGGPMRNPVWGPMGYVLGGIANFAPRSRSATMFVARETAERVSTLVDWLAGGDLVPHVERSYPMQATAEAMAHIGSGRTRGKLLLEGVA